jgi:hypothetical protein
MPKMPAFDVTLGVLVEGEVMPIGTPPGSGPVYGRWDWYEARLEVSGGEDTDDGTVRVGLEIRAEDQPPMEIRLRPADARRLAEELVEFADQIQGGP